MPSQPMQGPGLIRGPLLPGKAAGVLQAWLPPAPGEPRATAMQRHFPSRTGYSRAKCSLQLLVVARGRAQSGCKVSCPAALTEPRAPVPLFLVPPGPLAGLFCSRHVCMFENQEDTSSFIASLSGGPGAWTWAIQWGAPWKLQAGGQDRSRAVRWKVWGIHQLAGTRLLLGQEGSGVLKTPSIPGAPGRLLHRGRLSRAEDRMVPPLLSSLCRGRGRGGVGGPSSQGHQRGLKFREGVHPQSGTESQGRVEIICAGERPPGPTSKPGCLTPAGGGAF